MTRDANRLARVHEDASEEFYRARERRVAVESAGQQAERIRHSVQKVFLDAPLRTRISAVSVDVALAEVGAIPLGAGESLVLQPRSLVGVVQRSDRPIGISRRWVSAPTSTTCRGAPRLSALTCSA